MVFWITYLRKIDAINPHFKPRKTFFAEHDTAPSSEEIDRLVKRVSGGDFAQESIEIQECVGFNAELLKKRGISVHQFE